MTKWTVTRTWTVEAATAGAALVAADSDVTDYTVDVRPANPWEPDQPVTISGLDVVDVAVAGGICAQWAAGVRGLLEKDKVAPQDDVMAWAEVESLERMARALEAAAEGPGGEFRSS